MRESSRAKTWPDSLYVPLGCSRRFQRAKGCKGQPASHTKACTAPLPQLCTFSCHCPNLILEGGQFNVIISLVWIKPKSQAGQRNPRGVCALPFTHENQGSGASKATPPSIVTPIEHLCMLPWNAPCTQTTATETLPCQEANKWEEGWWGFKGKQASLPELHNRQCWATTGKMELAYASRWPQSHMKRQQWIKDRGWVLIQPLLFLTSAISMWSGCSPRLWANLAALPHQSHPLRFLGWWLVWCLASGEQGTSCPGTSSAS